MDAHLIRRRVLVSGRVQGVGFRDWCARIATAEGAAGWVRNRRDGRVEAVFEGPPRVVGTLVAWCGHGPSSAVVTGIEVHDEAAESLTGFRVAATE